MYTTLNIILDIKRFLEVGHTQNAGDSMHSTIETYCKHRNIYTPEHWGQMIMKARTNERGPYKVIHIQQEDIKEFSEIAKTFSWEKSGIAQIREFHVDPNDPKLAYARHNYNETPKVANIFRKSLHGKNFSINTIREHEVERLQDVELNPAYTEKLPLSKKKIDDFEKVLQKDWIPRLYHEYYSKLME